MSHPSWPKKCGALTFRHGQVVVCEIGRGHHESHRGTAQGHHVRWKNAATLGEALLAGRWATGAEIDYPARLREYAESLEDSVYRWALDRIERLEAALARDENEQSQADPSRVQNSQPHPEND